MSASTVSAVSLWPVGRSALRRLGRLALRARRVQRVKLKSALDAGRVRKNLFSPWNITNIRMAMHSADIQYSIGVRGITLCAHGVTAKWMYDAASAVDLL